jgi:hypothetical protein
MKQLLTFMLLFAVAVSHAQTVDEVIQKYANAMGGLENFKKVKTAKFSGTATAQGQDFPLTVQIVNGSAMRTDVEVMGQAIVNVYKDGKGWKINPFAGSATATDATADELKEFKNQASISTALMDYKDRGYKATLDGQEDVDGAKAYKIRLAADSAHVDTYYVDASTYMVIKFTGSRPVMGNEMQIETYFSDVKEFNGLKFSTTRTVKSEGQEVQSVHFDKIELNVPVDEKIFEKG